MKELTKELTKEQAIALYDSEFWKDMSYRAQAEFQMNTNRLCMPFDVFHEAMEKTLGRSVWTHEFGLNPEGLRKELTGEAEPPTFQEIINLIPKDKRMIVVKLDK